MEERSSAFSKPKIYSPRKPEEKLFYQVIQDNWLTYKELVESNPDSPPIPEYVENEMQKILDCGVLTKGFIRLKCDECGEEQLLGMSCKGRLCTSCSNKRMIETAEHLCGNVLPEVPYRQYVFSLPFPLKQLLAKNSELMSAVGRIFCKQIRRHILKGVKKKATKHTGMISFFQRFGSALQITPHFHVLVMQGYYEESSNDSYKFKKTPAPTDEEIADLLNKSVKKIKKLLFQKGYICEGYDGSIQAYPEAVTPEDIFEYASLASVAGKVGIGERAGQEVRRLGRVNEFFGEVEQSGAGITSSRCAELDGYSLHANTAIKKDRRDRLYAQISYMCRPALSTERLEQLPTGELVYHFKKPWRDGTHSILLTPLELIEKIVSLIPPPYKNMVHYFGIFGPNSKHRKAICPQSSNQNSASDDKVSSNISIDWATLMKKCWGVDLKVCKSCGGALTRVSVCTDPFVIKKILEHLNVDSDPPEFTKADPAKLGGLFSYT